MGTVTGQFATNFASLSNENPYISNSNLSYNGADRHQILSAVLTGTSTTAGVSLQYYNGTVLNTGIAKAKYEVGANPGASDYMYGGLINQTSGASYRFRLEGTALNLYKFSDWTTFDSTLATTTLGTAPVSTDEIEIWKDYSTNQITVYVNGSIVSALTVTDASYGTLAPIISLWPQGSNSASWRSMAFDGISSGVTVSPAAATLTFTGGTPTVNTGSGQTVNPATATLTFTGATPTITTQNYTWYDLPAPGSYDSNSILAGQTYPTGSWLRVVTDFAHITYDYAAAEAAGELDNDINDHAVAEGGYTGNDTATYEIKTPSGSTAQYTITADVQESGISLGPAAATLTFTGGIPTVTVNVDVTINPAAAVLAFTGGIPTVTGITIMLNPATAVLNITGTTPIILNGPLSDSGRITRRLTGRLTRRLKRA